MAEGLAIEADDVRVGQFFDWASTSPLSASAVSTRDRYMRRIDGAVDAPGELRRATLELEGLRDTLRTSFGAPLSTEVVLGRSVSEMMTLLARGLACEGRHRVVVTELDHPSAVLPWSNTPDKRWEVVVAPSDGDGSVDLQALAALVDERTALVALTHVSHVHGVVQPVPEVTRIARAAGSLAVVDGAQAVGRIAVNVGQLGCDAYVASARKSLRGPMGAGFMVAERALLEGLWPLLHSTRAADAPDVRVAAQGQATLADIPVRFEGNLPDMAALHAMWGAVMSGGHLVESLMALTAAVLPDLTLGFQRLGLEPVVGAQARGAGIATFLTPCQSDAGVVKRWLDDVGVVVAAGEGSLRISLHIPNTERDVETLMREVSRAIR